MSAFGSHDMAVDLGSANTLVYVRGYGIVICEPSVVAIDPLTRRVHAVGVRAEQITGRRDDGVAAIRPIRDGIVADFGLTELGLIETATQTFAPVVLPMMRCISAWSG